MNHIKKLLSGILALTLCISSSAMAVNAASATYFRGDINGDGKVNTSDVNRANLHAKGKNILTGYEFACADVNGDGKVNTSDVNRLNLHSKKKSYLW